MEKPWFNIVNKTADEATIRMYGDIMPGNDEGTMSADKMSAAIEDLVSKGVKKINLRINSNGGDVAEGIAIYNAICRCITEDKCEVVAYIDGIAASMAGIIAMACSKICMAKNARLMIHAPSGFARGSAKDMRQYADELDSWENSLKQCICDKCDMTMDAVNAWFAPNEDSWFNAQDALDRGLVDEIIDPVAKKSPPKNIVTGGAKSLWSFYNSALTITDIDKNQDMNIQNIMAAKLPIDGLKEDMTEAQFIASIKNSFHAKDQAIKEKEDRIKELEDAAKEAESSAIQAKAKSLVDGAIKAGKLIEGDRAAFEKDAIENYELTERVINKIPEFKSPTDQITDALKGKTEEEIKAIKAKGGMAARMAEIDKKTRRK